MKTVNNAFLRENSMCQTKCTSPGYWVIDQDRNCVSVFYWNRKGKMKHFFLEDLLLTEPGYLLCLFTRVVTVWGFLVGDFFERVTGDKHSDIFESKFCLFFSAHTNTHHFFLGLPPERSLRILSLLFCVAWIAHSFFLCFFLLNQCHGDIWKALVSDPKADPRSSDPAQHKCPVLLV